MIRKTISPLLTGLALAWAAHAPAASVLFDFNSDPTANGLLTIYGSALWIGSGGVGSATNSNDGFLLLTPAVNSQNGAVIFADFDNGAVVQGFTFETDVRIGNGTSTPADGFSINYVRDSDPILTQATNNPDPGSWTWGTSPAGGTSAEEGSSTGIGIGFDAYANGGTPPYPDELNQSIGPDIVALSVRVDGILVLQYPMPTLNGSVTDPISLQTGPIDTSDPGDYNVLGWAHLKVDLSTTGVLNVYYKNTQILSNFQTSYFPSPGQLVLGARTGGLNETQDVDNILITTIPATVALVGQASGLPDGFSVTIGDSGTNSVVDTTKPVTATLNGANAAPLSVTKSGTTTTVIYHGYPLLLAPGSTNAVTVTAKDTYGNTVGGGAAGTRSFVEGAYSTVPAGDAVSNVNTSLPGFHILPWQSGAEPNNVYWVQEQLMGLHGANNANLNTATDGGYIDFTKIINFNISPASAGGGDIGNFTTANGYPDSLFPGIPGANGLNGSTALEVLTFLKFNQPGVYQMGVNSDDGFAVTEGKNPRDRFAQVLGEYDAGRGSSDSLFYIAVTNAGIYPIRLIWENGNGELPDNGANLEWFMVDTNGVKILVNDPNSTNDTGVVAYYSGPALPAFVSFINPYIGTTRAWPHELIVQLMDGATTVNGSSIQFSIDGIAMPAPTVSKSGTVTTATLNLFNQALTSAAHTATLVWSDSAGTTHSNGWPFTVESYVVADSSQAVPTSDVDPSQPGFALHVAHIDFDNVGDSGDYIANQADWANAMLAGSVWPWWGTNTIDTTTVPPVASNLWYWPNPIDFNDVTSPGDFGYDYTTPGIPGPDGSTESFAKWFDGWVVFPQAGYYRMSISSDDNFRVSEGIGLLRQVLHIKGAKVDRDVAAVVNDNQYNNNSYGAPPPVVPINAPVFLVTSNNYVPGQALNLSGKIAVADSGLYGAGDALLAYIAQTNGALAFIELWPVAYGCPNMLGGTPPGPVNIPCLVVNSFNGEHDTWTTNTDLVATIGASQNLIWGADDQNGGKGMGRIDFPVLIATAGAYPLHVTYEQGTGGAGMEWQTYQYGLTLDATNMVIINDTNTPASLVAYRAVKVLPTPTLSLGKQGTSWVITYTGVLRSCSTVNGSYQLVPSASSPYTIPTSAAPMMFYRAYQN